MEALRRWKSALRGWEIPEEIGSRAPETPWGFPPGVFEKRTVSALRRPLSLSHRRALEALSPSGTLLDVGVGAGASSLPLAPHTSIITGVDSSEKMLEAFSKAAHALGANARAVHGAWPEIAGTVEPADVAVCHHVLFNIPDLGPFASALNDKAGRRVVVEMTPHHPMAWMNDLWLKFHHLRRPLGPTYEDAVAALRELGFRVSCSVHQSLPVLSGFETRAGAVAFVRKRLCLQPSQDEALGRALGERLSETEGLWSAGPLRHMIVTLWWDTRH